MVLGYSTDMNPKTSSNLSQSESLGSDIIDMLVFCNSKKFKAKTDASDFPKILQMVSEKVYEFKFLIFS